jgi:hypothetical protein
MTITVDIKPEVQAELAHQAAMRGVGIDAYAASLIETAARPAAITDEPRSSATSREVVEAIEALRRFGSTHRLSLGEMTIRDLRHEVRPWMASSWMLL